MSILAALIPVLSWLSLNAATGVLLTVPVQYRLAALPAILIPATISFKTIHHLDFIPGLSELWGTITLIGFIHFSSLLYIKGWTLRATCRACKPSKSTDTCLSGRLWMSMYKVATNPRFVRVPFKHVIPPANHNGISVKSTAVHGRFTLKKIPRLCTQISLLMKFNRLVLQYFGPISISDFAPAKAVLFQYPLQPDTFHTTQSISMREIVMRFWVTVDSICIPILLLDAIHTGLAVLFIYVLRIDVPEDWPDLFGSPFEAFTLGQFWTRFWHRVHLSGYSDYVHLMLPHWVRRNAAVKKVVMIFSLFLISGVIHQLTSWQLHQGCGDFADIQFFCANAAAVILESALLQTISPHPSSADGRRRRGETSRLQEPVPALLLCFLGYTWVIGFFVWILPMIYYPRIHCMALQQV